VVKIDKKTIKKSEEEENREEQKEKQMNGGFRILETFRVSGLLIRPTITPNDKGVIKLSYKDSQRGWQNIPLFAGTSKEGLIETINKAFDVLDSELKKIAN